MVLVQWTIIRINFIFEVFNYIWTHLQNIISYVDKEVTSLKQPEKDFRSTNNKKMTSILYVLMPKNFIETYFIMILIVVTVMRNLILLDFSQTCHLYQWHWQWYLWKTVYCWAWYSWWWAWGGARWPGSRGTGGMRSVTHSSSTSPMSS